MPAVFGQPLIAHPGAHLVFEVRQVGELGVEPCQLLIRDPQGDQCFHLPTGVNHGAVRGGKLGELLDSLVGKRE